MSAVTDTAHQPLDADGMSMYDSMQDNINRQRYDCTLSFTLYQGSSL